MKKKKAQCKKCGSEMQQLVECYEQLDIGSDDELIRKTTTYKYKQCINKACGYTVTTSLKVEDEKLPYKMVI